MSLGSVTKAGQRERERKGDPVGRPGPGFLSVFRVCHILPCCCELRGVSGVVSISGPSGDGPILQPTWRRHSAASRGRRLTVLRKGQLNYETHGPAGVRSRPSCTHCSASQLSRIILSCSHNCRQRRPSHPTHAGVLGIPVECPQQYACFSLRWCVYKGARRADHGFSGLPSSPPWTTTSHGCTPTHLLTHSHPDPWRQHLRHATQCRLHRLVACRDGPAQQPRGGLRAMKMLPATAFLTMMAAV